MERDGVLERLGVIAGDFVGGFADLPIVRLTSLAIAGYTVLLWLASAWWAMHDLRRRHDDPALPYLAAALVILASPLLFPLALVVYVILRPSSTLAERRWLTLEARLDELEAEGAVAARCAHCSAQVEEGWLICPSCRGRLGYACAECGGTMGSDWTLCAWCGAEIGARRRGPAARPSASVHSLAAVGSPGVQAAIARRA